MHAQESGKLPREKCRRRLSGFAAATIFLAALAVICALGWTAWLVVGSWALLILMLYLMTAIVVAVVVFQSDIALWQKYMIVLIVPAVGVGSATLAMSLLLGF